MNLEEMGVQEMKSEDFKKVDGGFLGFLYWYNKNGGDRCVKDALRAMHHFN